MTRASNAKRPSSMARSVLLPRKPLQKRSRERFEILLRATDRLISERSIDDIGLHDIARRASVPSASAYHFFPTREAAFAALAERYLTRLDELNAKPLPMKQNHGWQDRFTMVMRRSIKFYNDNPVFMRLVLGGAVSVEVRQLDLAFNHRYVERAYDLMNRKFVMPPVSNAPMRFYALLAIFDGMASASYGRFGCVTDEYRDELIRAVIAYFRTFLPEVLPRREEDGLKLQTTTELT